MVFLNFNFCHFFQFFFVLEFIPPSAELQRRLQPLAWLDGPAAQQRLHPPDQTNFIRNLLQIKTKKLQKFDLKTKIWQLFNPKICKKLNQNWTTFLHNHWKNLTKTQKFENFLTKKLKKFDLKTKIWLLFYPKVCKNWTYNPNLIRFLHNHWKNLTKTQKFENFFTKKTEKVWFQHQNWEHFYPITEFFLLKHQNLTLFYPKICKSWTSNQIWQHFYEKNWKSLI